MRKWLKNTHSSYCDVEKVVFACTVSNNFIPAERIIYHNHLKTKLARISTGITKLWGKLVTRIIEIIFWVCWMWVSLNKQLQESRAAARKLRDAVAVLFGIKFAMYSI